VTQKNQYILDVEKIGISSVLQASFPTLGKLSAYIPIPQIKEAAEISRRNHGYAEQSLLRHKTLSENGDPNIKQTLLSKMYNAQGEESLTQRELVNNSQAYIVAGSDTTSNTLTYLIWAVCRRPDIKEKLVKELETLPDDFTDVEVKQLPYLRLVIEETLRKYSAAPSPLPRVVPSGGANFGKYWLPEGTIATTQAYTLHRNPVAFPTPEKFDPLRWENPSQAMKDSFMPFGGGTRGILYDS
jgi:cytochrome P450